MDANASDMKLARLSQTRRRLGRLGPVPVGLLTGGIGLAISFALKGLIPARPLGDPLPLMLAATQALRGFSYFQWQPPLFHLLFALFLGVLAFFITHLVVDGRTSPAVSKSAGRVAALVNVGLVALLAVDAVTVGLWYLLSGWVSVLVTGFSAGRVASWWLRRRPPA